MAIPATSATINLKTLAQLAGIKQLIEGLRAVITTTAEFESQMSRVAAVSGATNAEIEKLAARARQLGADTIFTAKEAGEGMEELTRLGFTVQETFIAVEATLNLAAASALGLGRASEIAAGFIRSFGLDVSEIARVTDILALTAAKTGADVDSIGEAVAQAGALAKTAGIGIDEFNAFIGVLGDRLIKGSQAGTGFRQFIISLTADTPKLRASLAKINLEFQDVDITTRGLSPVLATLRDAFDQLETKTDRVGIAAEIFGRRTFNAALVAIDSVDKFDSLIETFITGEDAVKSMANVMNDNLAGSLKLYQSAMSELGITIGSEVTPEIQDLIELLIRLVKEFASTDGSARSVGRGLANLVDGITIVVSAIASVPNAFEIVFNTVLNAQNRFKVDFLASFADLANFLGEDELAFRLRENALSLVDAIDENTIAIEEGKVELEGNLLAFTDAMSRAAERWNEEADKLGDVKVDVSNIQNSIKNALSGIKNVINSEGEGINEEVQVLRDILSLKEAFEDSGDISKEGAAELKVTLDLLIALFKESGLELDQSVLIFRESLDNIGKSVKKASSDVEIESSGLSGVLNRVGEIVLTSGEKIKAGADKIRKSFVDIIGIDRDKVLEDTAALEGALQRISEMGITLSDEKKQKLKVQITEILENFAQLKENVPPLIRALASEFGLVALQFDSVAVSAGKSGDAVKDATDKMSASSKSASDGASGISESYSSMADSVGESAQKVVTWVTTIDKETGKVSINVILKNKEMGDSANEMGEKFKVAGEGSSEFSKAQEQVAESTRKGKEEVEGVSIAAETTAVNMDKAATSTEKMATAGASLESSLSGSAGQMDGLATAGERFNAVMDKINSKILKITVDDSQLQAAMRLLNEFLAGMSEVEALA